MEIEGMIIRDLGRSEGVSKAGNPWQKHEWVLETTGQYPRKAKFDVFGEKCNTITFEMGKSYVIQVDVESREFNERWYTDLHCYAARPIEAGAGVNQAPVQQNNNVQPPFPAQPQAGNPFGAQPAPDFSKTDSQEDLPF